jgi:hypothetical protein
MCNFNFCGLGTSYIEAVACYGIHCSHLEPEGYLVECVGYHSGIIGEGCRAFYYPRWEWFKQTVRKDRGTTRLQLVCLHGHCCDCDCVVSLPSSGKSLMILFPA